MLGRQAGPLTSLPESRQSNAAAMPVIGALEWIPAWWPAFCLGCVTKGMTRPPRSFQNLRHSSQVSKPGMRRGKQGACKNHGCVHGHQCSQVAQNDHKWTGQPWWGKHPPILPPHAGSWAACEVRRCPQGTSRGALAQLVAQSVLPGQWMAAVRDADGCSPS